MVETVFVSERRLQMGTIERAAWAAVTVLAASALHAQPCAENYTAEGAAATGMTFRTWQDFGMTPDEAFARVHAAMASDGGYTIVSSDKTTGVISTTQGVTNSAARLPYNIVVSEQGGGSRVLLTFGTTGWLLLNQQDVVKQFCKTLAAVGQ
jgi:hypothetical protein